MSELNEDLGRAHDVSEKLQIRLEQHLADVSDLSLIILKGHLLIEEVIDKSLQLLMFNPDEYFKTNPSFFNKVQLIKALSIFHQIGPGLEAILKLNNIRNKLAHFLEHPNIENLIEEYLTDIEKSRTDPDYNACPAFTDKKLQIEQRIKSSIYYLGVLAGYAPVFNKLLNKYDDNGKQETKNL